MLKTKGPPWTEAEALVILNPLKLTLGIVSIFTMIGTGTTSLLEFGWV
jgi:hypothetical protein